VHPQVKVVLLAMHRASLVPLKRLVASFQALTDKLSKLALVGCNKERSMPPQCGTPEKEHGITTGEEKSEKSLTALAVAYLKEHSIISLVPLYQ